MIKLYEVTVYINDELSYLIEAISEDQACSKAKEKAGYDHFMNGSMLSYDVKEVED